MQPSFLDGLSFDPFSSIDDGLSPSEVDVGRRDVVETLIMNEGLKGLRSPDLFLHSNGVVGRRIR